ncbi:4-hydroxy-tetrahydrodipicolinate synthase [Algoriphagus ratkowskyi]|uniref:4-hydroxy-tetrahydrodipicolinate synthase n=1 Tax=Algoriphagus ratkowskyi TaxID=57028 RepID=A0A2W7R468_9BACT|nr:dihydrodipicolinate synthase family protein [Algoriphagus ratkowskyi]PZX53070.1 4-hydroxy-tetrahydrodipicolinate synthase [Algoriphagus ratkowskyi]TXD76351.1 dihydrodipicolinate synthase family protein [Algoriphagus ratkowskyi]
MSSFSKKNSPLKGIVPPMITPLNQDGSLDTESTAKLIEHLISGGVHGIFILGTTGEFTGLSYDVRRELIFETCNRVAGRVPVLVGIADVSLEESIKLGAYAAEAGAYALVVAPPFYMNIDQQEMCAYYEQLADAITIPMYLYNMPSHTKLTIELDTVIKLSAHERIIGLKDSSAHGVYFQSLCHAFRDHEDFMLMVGPEEMMAETVLMGSHGGVAGGANLYPQLYVALYEAAANRDFEKIKKYQYCVMEISRNIYQVGGFKSSYMKGLKTAMSFAGLCQAVFAPPLYPFSSGDVEELRSRVEKIDALLKENQL